MPIVLLHELLDRQQVRRVLKAPGSRDPDLFIEGEDVLGTPGMKMQFIADAPEEILGGLDRHGITGGQDAPFSQRFKGGRTVAG